MALLRNDQDDPAALLMYESSVCLAGDDEHGGLFVSVSPHKERLTAQHLICPLCGIACNLRIMFV